MVVDDGTVTRLEDNWFRVSAAEPVWFWLERCRRGFDVEIQDSASEIAMLSLQGPTSRGLLKDATNAPVEKLKYFRTMNAELDGHSVLITRTGYTGDLGFEIWMDREKALPVWDALMDHGRAHGITPAGLDAMDVTRVEAGYVMNGVDYTGAHHCLIEAQKSTPDELGLDWTVQLEREPFIGQNAIRAERERGSRWCFKGLVMDWPDYEAVCGRYGLPPEICTKAWRTSIPLYNYDGRQIGYATSGAWSPILKKNLALAALQPDYGEDGKEIRMEVTVEHTRHQVKAYVVDLPFFDPARKRSLA
jgi:aminomethyltransferase